jgi:hypothetical protein
MVTTDDIFGVTLYCIGIVFCILIIFIKSVIDNNKFEKEQEKRRIKRGIEKIESKKLSEDLDMKAKKLNETLDKLNEILDKYDKK